MVSDGLFGRFGTYIYISFQQRCNCSELELTRTQFVLVEQVRTGRSVLIGDPNQEEASQARRVICSAHTLFHLVH